MKPILIILLFSCAVGFADVLTTFELGEEEPGLAGNGVTDLVRDNNTLWIGTGGGLSRYDFMNESLTAFEPRKTEGLVRGSVSGLFVSGDTIWVSAAADSFVRSVETTLSYGTGLSVSTDGGATWTRFDQPGPTPIQNVTYDITVVDNVVYGASFGGGMLRSEDWGQTWEQATPDSLLFNPNAYLNHRVFSLLNANGTLWVGTAQGINKSTDNGQTWENFNFYNTASPISGNFVVALAMQETGGEPVIWAATWRAEGEDEEYGVSFSKNGGRTWETTLLGEKVHNLTADGNVIYAASDNGLWKSDDGGESWFVFDDIQDSETGERIYSSEYYSVSAESDDVWTGTADGLARTRDNGFTWTVIRSFESTAESDEPRTYAYPNPFSPNRDNRYNDAGHVRLQYNVTGNTYVTVKVYDFAMDLVTTICDNKARTGPGDYNEVWNGVNDLGDEVANGVYFYSVDIENDGVYWGKILIVN